MPGAETARTDDGNWSQGYSLSRNIKISNKRMGTERSHRAAGHQSTCKRCWVTAVALPPPLLIKQYSQPRRFFFLLLPHSIGIGSAQTKVWVLSSSPGSTHHRKLHAYLLSAFQREKELCIIWYYSKFFWCIFKKGELTPKLVAARQLCKHHRETGSASVCLAWRTEEMFSY